MLITETRCTCRPHSGSAVRSVAHVITGVEHGGDIMHAVTVGN